MKNYVILLIILLFLATSCSNDQDSGSPKASKDPIKSFMTYLGNKEYEKIEQTFSKELSEFWSKSSLAKDIKEIRETLNDTWNPEETNFMNWQTKEGLVIQKSFRLQKNFKSQYSLSFTTKTIDKIQKIINFNATAPYQNKPPVEAVEVSNEFVTFIKDQKHSEAKAMVIPTFQQRFTDEIFETVRGVLVSADGTDANLGVDGHRSLINGVWYETIVYTSKDAFLKHVSVYLSLVNNKYSVVTIDFKNYNKIN